MTGSIPPLRASIDPAPRDRSAVLDRQRRAGALDRMPGRAYDVVVIGGGVVGAGAALDAATRGLSVALLEMRDYASGTSSRSSKLIHGGLRYLEQRRFSLVREALRERSLLLTRLCPHLLRPVPLLFPLTHRVWERAYIGAGTALYDAMGGARVLPRHRHLTRRGVLRLAPGVRPDAVVGGIQYHDAQVDDARHTMTVARTAAAHGADLATRTQVTGLLRDSRRVQGVRAVDLETGRTFEVRARAVVSTTGVWTDDVQALVEQAAVRVRTSKGVHLIVPRQRFDSQTGLVLRAGESVLFIIPWGRHWLLGTTDTDWAFDRAHPAASRRDVHYILTQANRFLVRPLTVEDVQGVYAGLRPLLAGESETTSGLSREHVVVRPLPGLVITAGGKYTTYRLMARDSIDVAARDLERPVPPSCTEHVPLLGAGGYRAIADGLEEVAAASEMPPASVERLLGRYGSAIRDILALVARRPELSEPLEGAADHLAAEVVYAASHEGALHLEDVLTRRTRISIETWDRGLAAAEPAARLLSGVLEWSEEQMRREVDYYRLRVEAEREAQEQPDDVVADAVRRRAPDIVPVVSSAG